MDKKEDRPSGAGNPAEVGNDGSGDCCSLRRWENVRSEGAPAGERSSGDAHGELDKSAVNQGLRTLASEVVTCYSYQ